MHIWWVEINKQMACLIMTLLGINVTIYKIEVIDRALANSKLNIETTYHLKIKFYIIYL